MKFNQLFEMPTFINKELPIDDVPVEIMSVDTLDREYDLLSSIDVNGGKAVGAIKKNHKSAIIGRVVQREDGKKAIRLAATLTFHETPSLGEVKGNVLQVDTIVAHDELRGAGFGYTLYKMLLNAGFILASDNVQYIGGQQLWRKIIRNAIHDGHHVRVLVDGKLYRDENGQVVVYDGKNIPDDVIWSENKKSVQHYNTLLVVSNN